MVTIFFPVGVPRGHRARPDCLTVDMYRASPALRTPAPVFGAGQIEFVAKHPQQRHVAIDAGEIVLLPVDVELHCRSPVRWSAEQSEALAWTMRSRPHPFFDELHEHMMWHRNGLARSAWIPRPMHERVLLHVFDDAFQRSSTVLRRVLERAAQLADRQSSPSHRSRRHLPVRGAGNPRSLVIALLAVTAAAAHPRNTQIVAAADNARRMATARCRLAMVRWAGDSWSSAGAAGQ